MTDPNIAHTLPPDFYEKTLTNIANLRQEYEHNDTLHRFLGDAEAAIANLIVLEAEATTARDLAVHRASRECAEAREDAHNARNDRDSARSAVGALESTVNQLQTENGHRRADLEIVRGRLASEHRRRVVEVEMFDRILGTAPIEDTMHAAERVVRERDSARAAVPALEATVRRLEAENNRLGMENQRVRNRITETTTERDNLRRDLDQSERRSNGRQSLLSDTQKQWDAEIERTKRAESRLALARAERDRALAAALEARNEIEDWRMRFDALTARATRVVQERDEARAAAAKAPTELFQVGEIVQHTDGRRARVRGHYIFSDGCKFVTVESAEHGKLKTYHWRESLCRGVADSIEPDVTPPKVGDRVVNVADGNTPATVIGFFESIEGVRFVAVESTWGKSYFWRLDLVQAGRS